MCAQGELLWSPSVHSLSIVHCSRSVFSCFLKDFSFLNKTDKTLLCFFHETLSGSMKVLYRTVVTMASKKTTHFQTVTSQKTTKPRALIIGMKHCQADLYNDYSNLIIPLAGQLYTCHRHTTVRPIMNRVCRF